MLYNGFSFQSLRNATADMASCVYQKNGHQPMYMAARFFLSVAFNINSSTCPSTESGTDWRGNRPLSLFLMLSITPSGVSGTSLWVRLCHHTKVS